MPEESFEELLDSYQRDRETPVGVGERIKGKVIQAGQENVFVDVGAKIDAVVAREELVDSEGQLSVREGDEVELYVVAAGPGEIRLSRAMSGIGGMHLLQEAFHNRVPVEGKVTATRKGGFDVTVLQRRAFCPVSQMDAVYVQDPEVYVGQEFRFLITKLEEEGRNIVISRRQILEQEQAEAREKFVETARKGDLLEGTVVRLAPFGAFVEVAPHVEGLVHLSELSWSRTEAAEDVVAVGDRIKVKIVEMDRTQAGQLKIGLSLKQAGGDPWVSAAETFKSGAIVSGKVTRLAPFGAFVEIVPGIEGLVHLSEMSFAKRVHKAEDMVAVGQGVQVKILSVNPDTRRISLSLREAEGDPWTDVVEKYPRGRIVAGVVEKVEPFGLFVQLEPGITGLLPRSSMERSPSAKALKDLKPQSQVSVLVEAVRPSERKISLAPADLAEDEGWKGYAAPAGQGGFGSLGDKLRAAVRRKKE